LIKVKNIFTLLATKVKLAIASSGVRKTSGTSYLPRAPNASPRQTQWGYSVFTAKAAASAK